MNDFEFHLDKFMTILERMDQAYQETAIRYGFVCPGCTDNCCETRFYHFTLLEYLLLRKGFSTLDADTRNRLGALAGEVCRLHQAADAAGDPVRVMCPLNDGGRCTLYQYRPMICRLHGVPHCLSRPDGRMQVGPGCALFESQCGQSRAYRLDRTPHYQAMAALEKQLRDSVGPDGFRGRIRMTVAEILLSDGMAGLPPLDAF